jgi:hypothetical protein
MKLIGSRQAWLFAIVPGLALLAVAAAHAGQESTQPDGFGKAKFGMNEEQVRKLFPQAKEIILPTPVPGKVAFPLALTDYDLADQSIGPFHQCKVRLRLYDHALTQVHFTCPKKDKDKVKDYLVKRFGPPASTGASALSWSGGKTAVTLSPVSGTFMFADAARDQAASRAILAAIMQAQQPAAATPPEAPTPPPGAAQ